MLAIEDLVIAGAEIPVSRATPLTTRNNADSAEAKHPRHSHQ